MNFGFELKALQNALTQRSATRQTVKCRYLSTIIGIGHLRHKISPTRDIAAQRDETYSSFADMNPFKFVNVKFGRFQLGVRNVCFVCMSMSCITALRINSVRLILKYKTETVQ